MKYLLVFLLSSILFSQSNNSFNPERLIDPEPRWPEILNPLKDNGPMIDTDRSLDTNITEIEGFRVQVFATQDRNRADELQGELNIKFNEKIYIIFEAPNYKLRVGDFLDRDDAELMRMKLVSSNFPSAWVVRTKIQPDIIE